jgi:hypothetical protein
VRRLLFILPLFVCLPQAAEPGAAAVNQRTKKRAGTFFPGVYPAREDAGSNAVPGQDWRAPQKNGRTAGQ